MNVLAPTARVRALRAALLLLLPLGGCTGGDAAGFDPPVPNELQIQVQTDPFDVAPGTEVFMCTVTDTVLDAPFDVVNVNGYQLTGGHHVALFYSMVPLEPGPTHPCTDAEMVNWRFVGGGAEGAEMNFHLPANTALEIPAGARLVLQSHYVNSDRRKHHVQDALTITTVADPATITAHADAFVITDSDFLIPPGGEQTRIVECTVDAETAVVNLLGHAHEWSTRVSVSLLAVGETTPTPLYDEVGGTRLQFAPPVVYWPDDAPLLLEPGDQIQLTCSWNNTTGEILGFPKEMCVALMYYLPSRGFLECGTPIATMGDVVDGSTLPGEGQHGCAAPPGPTEDCIRSCDEGNSEGVGRYCLPGAGDCDGNLSAVFCTADFTGDTAGFCTRPCESDLICGPEAYCTMGGCVPILCS